MITILADKIIIDIYVQPGAKITALAGLYDGRPKIKIAAEPTDGKANKEVCKFMAKLVGLAQKDIKLISGDKSRLKRIAIYDISANTQEILQGIYK